jgi:cystathionine beta-lyase/cystathionine gamma-synthase
LESPSNPHGYVLDVPAICKAAHQVGLRVILDATVGTPFLVKPLQRDDPEERPDFLVHSYTKDLSGSGTVIAGCVIARNDDMFLPKGEPGWDNTMFWNVYYTKGAFLNADAAFEVLQGLRTLESRMLSKCINTVVLAQFFARHPKIKVNASCLPESTNYTFAQSQLFLGLPAPLFTIEMIDVPLENFQRFFDSLEPTFAHMISLGQTNTIVSCPGLTTHSELGEEALSKAGISPTTMRFAVGMENPMDLLKHLVSAAKLAIDPAVSGFSAAWPDEDEMKALIEQIYLKTHQQYVKTLLD